MKKKEKNEKEMTLDKSLKIINNHKKKKTKIIVSFLLSAIAGLMVGFRFIQCLALLSGGSVYFINFLIFLSSSVLLGINIYIFLQSVFELIDENKKYKKSLKQMYKIKKKLREKGFSKRSLNNFRLIKTMGDKKINVYATDPINGEREVIEETQLQEHVLDLSNGTPVYVDADEYDYKVSKYREENVAPDQVFRLGVRQ